MIDHDEPFRDTPIRRRGRLLFRQRKVPVRLLVPNFFTLLSLCAGVTAIRMAIEARYELAIALIVIAALLDGVDGRLARALKAHPLPEPLEACRGRGQGHPHPQRRLIEHQVRVV